MTCPNCGAAVGDNRRFCGKCGTAVAPATAPGPAAAAPDVPPAPPVPKAPNAWGPPSGPAAQWGPPPATSPGPPPAGAADPFAPPPLAPPAGPDAWAGYGGPPPQYPPPPYSGQYPPGYPGAPGAWPGYGYAPARTNGFAVASLVLGLVGWLPCGIGSVLAIVFGFVARSQIKSSGGQQVGSGMATAGIVLGFIGAGFWLLGFTLQLASSSR